MGNPEIRQTVIGDHNLFTASGDIRINYQLPPADAEERRILLQLVDSVKRDWIEGVLERSLNEAEMLDLPKESLPDMVQHPWGRILELPGHPAQPLAAEKKIDEIFHETGRALLILGEPGAGKTVTLLKLASELIGRFENDPMQAAPVVLNLSTWQDKLTLATWIEAELKSKYSVSPGRSRVWLESSRLILLLDGLDEVPADRRPSCVRAINEFDRGLPGIVVCSRLTEYTALPKRLNFKGAVCLQPLTVDQVDGYLKTAGNQLASLRQAIREDNVLAELSRSPLMLSILSLALWGAGSNELARQQGSSEERRKQIFGLYVERMFQRKGIAALVFPKEKIIGWLSWLARKMKEHSQSVFLVEGLQPSWLVTRAKRVAYGTFVALSPALIFGLIFGLIERRQNHGTFWPILLWSVGPRVGLVILLGVGLGCWSESPLKNGIRSGSIGGLVFGLIVWVILGPILGTISGLGRAVGSGLVVGLIVALIGGLGAGSLGHITLVENTSWEWKQFWKRTIPGSVVGLIVGLIFGLNYGGGLNVGVIFGLILGPIFGLGSGLIGGFTDRVMVDKASPNQGINLSRKNSLAAFVVTSLIVGLSSGLTVGLIAGQGSGAPSGPSYWVYSWMFSWINSGLFDRLYDWLNYWLFCWLGPSLRLSYTLAHKVADGLLIGLIVALTVGLLVGLIVGLNRGGAAVIKHYSLRLILWWNGYTPFKFIKFLDQCAKLILLKKVGGGYIFIHRMLLEYFAELPPSRSELGLDLHAR